LILILGKYPNLGGGFWLGLRKGRFMRFFSYKNLILQKKINNIEIIEMVNKEE